MIAFCTHLTARDWRAISEHFRKHDVAFTRLQRIRKREVLCKKGIRRRIRRAIDSDILSTSTFNRQLFARSLDHYESATIYAGEDE